MKALHYTTAFALAALTASSAANSATIFNFGNPSGLLGNTQSYTSNGVTVIASGFTAANVATKLYGKNDGGDEVGLGLNNDPSGQHEISYGNGYVQLDVSALLGKFGKVTFFTGSTTQGEQWSIFGSNVASSYSGPALLSGTNELSANLPSFGTYKYYDFVSTSQLGGKNFIIGGLTAVPEPAAWAMMIGGFGFVGFAARRRKTNVRFA